MLPDFDIAPVRRVLHGKEADIYSCSALGWVSASVFGQLYGNYYHLSLIAVFRSGYLFKGNSDGMTSQFW
jgi:hypothetical protein